MTEELQKIDWTKPLFFKKYNPDGTIETLDVKYIGLSKNKIYSRVCDVKFNNRDWDIFTFTEEGKSYKDSIQIIFNLPEKEYTFYEVLDMLVKGEAKEFIRVDKDYHIRLVNGFFNDNDFQDFVLMKEDITNKGLRVE